jgi:hypothetical protein
MQSHVHNRVTEVFVIFAPSKFLSIYEKQNQKEFSEMQNYINPSLTFKKQTRTKYTILNVTKHLEGSEDKNVSCFFISLSLLVIQMISVFFLDSENS